MAHPTAATALSFPEQHTETASTLKHLLRLQGSTGMIPERQADKLRSAVCGFEEALRQFENATKRQTERAV